MAGDIIEFAKRKEDESLCELVNSIDLITKQAYQDNHKFLAYLLEMAHLEAQALLRKEQS